MNTAATEPMPATPADGRFERTSTLMTGVYVVALGKLLLHLLTANRYGFFGDELYFMACAKHLAWGYVDQPPLIALAVWLVRHTLGDSLFALHVLPALCGAALVVLTGLIAVELGAKRFGAGLAALAAAIAPVYLVLHHLMTMNAFEPLLWMGCAYVVVRIVKTGNQKLWLWFGVLAGVGMENKYSMALFGLAVVIGLLLTPERRALARPWIWIAGAIAFLIFLPNLIWNVQHHWPFIELMRNIKASGRDVVLGPFAFVRQQILIMNPLSLPIWGAGLGWLMFARDGRRFRVLGWTYLAALAIMIALAGKDYYLAPAYPMLFAAGGIAIERGIAGAGQAWLKPAIVIVLIALTAPIVPLFLQVLPVEAFARYQKKLPFKLEASEHSHMLEPLPHHYSWSFGWPEMVEKVAAVYNRLPPEERAKTAIFAKNFAEGGAIDLFGPKYGLPEAIGGHQNFWLWGPRGYTGDSIIIVGERYDDDLDECRELTIAATLDAQYAAPWEHRPILLCRGLKFNLQEAWPKVKNWD